MMDLELLEEHYKVPSQCVLVETTYYRLVMNEPGVAIPVRSGEDNRDGFYVLGKVKLEADAIVHTSEGAVGKVIKQRRDETIILGKSIHHDWEVIEKDSQKPEHTQCAAKLLKKLCRKPCAGIVRMGIGQHLIYTTQTEKGPDTWIIGSGGSETVVIDGIDVIVRIGEHDLVHVSGTKKTVEIADNDKILTIGGSEGIVANWNGKRQNLQNFLRKLAQTIRRSVGDTHGGYGNA